MSYQTIPLSAQVRVLEQRLGAEKVFVTFVDYDYLKKISVHKGGKVFDLEVPDDHEFRDNLSDYLPELQALCG